MSVRLRFVSMLLEAASAACCRPSAGGRGRDAGRPRKIHTEAALSLFPVDDRLQQHRPVLGIVLEIRVLNDHDVPYRRKRRWNGLAPFPRHRLKMTCAMPPFVAKLGQSVTRFHPSNSHQRRIGASFGERRRHPRRADRLDGVQLVEDRNENGKALTPIQRGQVARSRSKRARLWRDGRFSPIGDWNGHDSVEKVRRMPRGVIRLRVLLIEEQSISGTW